MAPSAGTRSAPDKLTWWCKATTCRNDPKRCRLSKVPEFQCKCGCGEEFSGDFEFCMDDIKANGYRLLGAPLDQAMTVDCTAYAYAKQLEVSRKVKELLQGRDPDSVPEMDPRDLVEKYERLMKGQEHKENGLSKVVHMAMIIKEEGMQSVDSGTIYKVSEVSTIKRDDNELIATTLADGHPLNAGILKGRKLKDLNYCEGYKPPPCARFLEKKGVPDTHAIVLVGAGRKQGKWYFFFMNSWRNFCCRYSPLGVKLCDGIGKVRGGRLFRNVVRLSRFKETRTEHCLEHQDAFDISLHNLRLLSRSR